YVWEDVCNPATHLPPFLLTNLCKLCEKYPRPRLPMLTYQDYVLNNWRLKNPEKGLTLDNIEPLFTFTGSNDEAWFITIHIVIEKICGDALFVVFQAMQCAKEGKTESLSQLFKTMTQALCNAIQIIKKMEEQCKPDYFYHVIRLYLNGWEHIKNHNYRGTS